MTESVDIYTEVTNTIITALQSAKSWESPWQKIGLGYFTNLSTGNAYQGVNCILLAIAKSRNGFNSDKWIGLKQAVAMGHRVTYEQFKNATKIIMPKLMPKKDKNGKPILDKNGKPESDFIGYRSAFVYNCDQLENYQETIIELPIQERLEIAESMVAPYKEHIRENLSDSAYYNPIKDFINIPSINQFKSSQLYYGTLFHELTHFTSHKDRLNRDLSEYSTKREVRAFEELIAELGAAFLCAETGILQETRADHESYLKSWLEALGNDNKFIFKAASQASKAAQWIKAA